MQAKVAVDQDKRQQYQLSRQLTNERQPLTITSVTISGIWFDSHFV